MLFPLALYIAQQIQHDVIIKYNLNQLNVVTPFLISNTPQAP